MIDTTLVIIDDSNSKDSSEQLGSYITSEIKKSPSVSTTIVVRHHILPENLKHVQNGESPSKYWSENEFSMIKQKIGSGTKVIFIYGDGGAFLPGAFLPLPRMTCTSISGFTNIVNGIGELKGDRIIIYSKGKLYYYIIP